MELNKRGQGLSVNAIILIVLGIFVLVALIVGFTIGFGDLKDRIAPSNNVATIVSACSTVCLTQSQYDFCTSKRDLKTEEIELKDVTCNYLAQKQPVYGIEICGSISCDNVVLSDTSVDDVEGIECGENFGKTVYALSNDGETLLNKDCPPTD